MKSFPTSFLFLFMLIQSSCISQNRISYFEGNWSFKIWYGTEINGNPDLEAEWKCERGLDSSECFTGRVKINETVFTREILGYNPLNKKYTRTIATDNGLFFQFTSDGWNGDEMIWIGTQFSKDGKKELKEIITIINENEFKAVFYVKQNKKWVQTQIEKLERLN